MMISVILTTARMGCFDVLVNCMNRQMFPKDEFEVIVVDACYKERREQLAPSMLPYNFYHVELPKKYDYYDPCWANNYALTLARGELVVFFTDLIWAYDGFLLDHWLVYKKYPGYSMTGYCDRYRIPRLKHNLGWHNGSWSVFYTEFTAPAAAFYFDMVEPDYKERKGNTRGADVPGEDGFFELPGDFFYAGLNESIPMAVLKELNGWDEIYDGGYAACDIDLGSRANHIGWKFLVNPNSITQKLGTKATSGVIPCIGKPEIRERGSNHGIYMERMNAIREGRESVKSKIGAW